MSEAKFTKGPWKVCYAAGIWVTQDCGERHGIAICEAMGDAECNEANAKLIAAAPDLYEALKDVAIMVRLYNLKPEQTSGFSLDVEKKLLAALAKADGL